MSTTAEAATTAASPGPPLTRQPSRPDPAAAGPSLSAEERRALLVGLELAERLRDVIAAVLQARLPAMRWPLAPCALASEAFQRTSALWPARGVKEDFHAVEQDQAASVRVCLQHKAGIVFARQQSLPPATVPSK